MAFLSQYRKLRGEDNTEMREIEYNFGRVFHQLGLYSHAVKHYEHVLELADKAGVSHPLAFQSADDEPKLWDRSRIIYMHAKLPITWPKFLCSLAQRCLRMTCIDDGFQYEKFVLLLDKSIEVIEHATKNVVPCYNVTMN
jgi:hypothetical protein